MRDYADEGLVVWAISTHEDVEPVARWVEDFDIDLPVLLDKDGAVTELYEQTKPFPSAVYPQEWLIGTDGVIEYYENTFQYDALVAVIEAELAGE